MVIPIVVVGAGVTGLTTALLLAKAKHCKVTVVAKHMPGDKDIEYASPWAGANFLPMSSRLGSKWERRTWPEFKRLTETVPEAGIHFQKARIYRRNKDLHDVDPSSGLGVDCLFLADPWYKDVLPDYRELGQDDDVLPGHDSGSEFTSICINTSMYLHWLVGQCVRAGVVFRRAVLQTVDEAKSMSHTGERALIVVNATGLGSLTLGGVEDAAMMPVRGQTVLVRNPCGGVMVTSSGTDDAPTDLLYTMERAYGGGTIIGGTYELGNWEAQPDVDVAERMMRRAVGAWPELANGRGLEGLSVVSHNVGLRPYRRGGVRVERETMEDGSWLIHNYGHAGWGYQGSYGCAERVVELVNGVRRIMVVLSYTKNRPMRGR